MSLSDRALRIAIDSINRKLDDPIRPFDSMEDERMHYEARNELADELARRGGAMSASEKVAQWVPINDYPGDQRYDDVPGTEDASYWGEIGTADAGRWSWTIIATDDQAEQWEAAGGFVDTEDEAKAAVEAWRPL
ncbi:hypothetical protein JRC04_05050 [Mycolicibacterium sp. S2-37]|uniref:hypothetical protein n=1 Tax=Mycolicibacterium sp. S2-37 TaxID=2810297 RepID=UPI001A94E9D1|nr:hypothetical protein [Mycolicibacterium sp. S2-37]MBO0676825.1 hypothetical protein [Mycolicibacterium sp. S2-37]